MDGVVADWNKGVESILGYFIEDPTTAAHYPDDQWEKIKAHERFYLELEVMPGATELADLARQFRRELGWQVLFLTAVSHYNDCHWAIWDKCLWAQKFFPDIPVHFGPYSRDKHVHCKPGDVLVDDRPSNINEWCAAGGIAIEVKYNGLANAIRELEELFNAEKVKLPTVGDSLPLSTTK